MKTYFLTLSHITLPSSNPFFLTLLLEKNIDTLSIDHSYVSFAVHINNGLSDLLCEKKMSLHFKSFQPGAQNKKNKISYFSKKK